MSFEGIVFYVDSGRWSIDHCDNNRGKTKSKLTPFHRFRKIYTRKTKQSSKVGGNGCAIMDCVNLESN